MSDLFHKDVPLEFIKDVFETIGRSPRHVFQILTKRPERLLQLAQDLPWYPNIWMGVSIESQQYVNRMKLLSYVPASVRFLSCEPLLSPLTIDLAKNDIHWVIVGGESGAKYRPMQMDWAIDIRNQCREEGVPFFFKQVGGRTPKANGRLLDGETWDEMPAAWQKHLDNLCLA